MQPLKLSCGLKRSISRGSAGAWGRRWERNSFQTLNEDAKTNLYRMFTGEMVFIPGLQIWEDLCGSSVQCFASYKNYRLSFENLPPVEGAEVWGYYRTRYRDGVNGYLLFMNLKQLMHLMGRGEEHPTYNFLEIELPGSAFNMDGLSKISRLTQEITGSDAFDISPWWDLADRDGVQFIQTVMTNLKWVALVMLLFGIIGFYYVSLRFSEEVAAEWWNPRRVFGGKTRTFVLIASGQMLLMMFFTSIISGSGVAVLNRTVNWLLYKVFLDPLVFDAALLLYVALETFLSIIFIYTQTLLRHSGRLGWMVVLLALGFICAFLMELLFEKTAALGVSVVLPALVVMIVDDVMVAAGKIRSRSVASRL